MIPLAMFDEKQKRLLLKLSAASIRHGLDNHAPLPVLLDDYDDALKQNRACFVTLEIDQQLRGCIGTLEAYRPLVQDVVENAYAAAFRDPRFTPLRESEYDALHYHISVLHAPQEMLVTSEQDLLQQLRPGVDGLIIEDAGRRATFLPSVWESLPRAADFLRHLKHKAGLSEHHWSDSMQVHRYVVEDIV